MSLVSFAGESLTAFAQCPSLIAFIVNYCPWETLREACHKVWEMSMSGVVDSRTKNCPPRRKRLRARKLGSYITLSNLLLYSYYALYTSKRNREHEGHLQSQ